MRRRAAGKRLRTGTAPGMKRLLLRIGPFALLSLAAAWGGLAYWIPAGGIQQFVIGALGIGVALLYLWLLVRRLRRLLAFQESVRAALIGLVGDLLLLLLAFAVVYRQVGLVDNTGSSPTSVHDFPLALYFSVVTFTTVGYGDFYPTGVGRLLAALEAMVGYLVLATIASTSVRLLSPDRQTPRAPGTPAADRRRR